MTTTSANYKYEYEILHFTSIRPGMTYVILGENDYEAIALANVHVTVKSAIDGREIDDWKELRYVIVDCLGEPDVTYRENPSYGGVHNYEKRGSREEIC